MRNIKLITLMMLLGVTLIGCAKDEGTSNAFVDPNYTGFYIPPTVGPGAQPGANLQYGATADITNVTYSSLSFYAKNAYVNNFTDLKVNLNLRKFDPAPGTNRVSYGGVVSIEFRNNGQLYRDSFTSLINENHFYGSGTVRTNEENNKYNVWITKNGKQAWHGFFQDALGSIIIVIDEATDLGDGQGATSVSGSIWVMNFGNTYAPLSPTSCWFVSAGPYDCRTWKDGKQVNTDRDIFPYLENSNGGTLYQPKSEGYRKLGDFYNLDLQKAFNE